MLRRFTPLTALTCLLAVWVYPALGDVRIKNPTRHDAIVILRFDAPDHRRETRKVRICAGGEVVLDTDRDRLVDGTITVDSSPLKSMAAGDSGTKPRLAATSNSRATSRDVRIDTVITIGECVRAIKCGKYAP